MNMVGRAAEEIARRIDRRTLLTRAAAGAFGFTAAAAVSGLRAPAAWANHCAVTSSSCQCSPLNGRYCANCQQAGCPNGCSAHTGDCPAGPNYQCWCTLSCCYNCGNPSASYCGHYKCCDCNCFGGNECTCRAFTYDCRSTAAVGTLAPPCC